MATIALRLLIGYPIIKNWRGCKLETDDTIEDAERRIEAMVETFYADDPNVRIESNLPLGVIGLRMVTAVKADDPTVDDLWHRLLTAAKGVQTVT